MNDKSRIAAIVSITLSAMVAIVAFFSHVNNLDSARRAEILALQRQMFDSRTSTERAINSRYAQFESRMATLESSVAGVNKMLDRLVGLMVQEYGELLMEMRHKRPGYSVSPEEVENESSDP